MGVYIVGSDLESILTPSEIVAATDDEGRGVVCESRLNMAIADAEAEVNAYLSERYTLPLASVPQVIKTITAEVAAWFLYSRAKFVDPEKHPVYVRYKSAVAGLGIANPPADTSVARASKSESDRVFTTSSLANYNVL
jgi:phage gp36-like protein